MITVLIKYTIMTDCDHNRSPHKKCHVSKFLQDCDHDHSSLYYDCVHDRSIHKNVLYLSLYEDCDHDHSIHI